MKNGKRIIGITLILVSVIFLFSWEKWGKEKFIYDEIIVLNENVEQGTVITGDMIERIKVDHKTKDALTYKDRGRIIGKEAEHSLAFAGSLMMHLKQNGIIVMTLEKIKSWKEKKRLLLDMKKK